MLCLTYTSHKQYTAAVVTYWFTMQGSPHMHYSHPPIDLLCRGHLTCTTATHQRSHVNIHQHSCQNIHDVVAANNNFYFHFNNYCTQSKSCPCHKTLAVVWTSSYHMCERLTQLLTPCKTVNVRTSNCLDL